MKNRYSISSCLMLAATLLSLHTRPAIALPEPASNPVYETAAAARLFEAALMGEDQGQPVHRGSVLATLQDNELRLVGFFGELTAPWIQLAVYHGDPATNGEVIHSWFTVPEGGGYSGGLDLQTSLTDAQVQALLDGELYFNVRTLGNRAEDLTGQIHESPLVEPVLLETSFASLRGEFTRRGTVLATLEENALHLVGYGYFADPVLQVDLYRGALGTPGEYLANLYLNPHSPASNFVGLDPTILLEPDLLQALLDGELYLEIFTSGRDKARGQLFLADNEAPAASQITTPANDVTIIIGGAEGENPLDPSTPLAEITFTAAPDPEGSPVAYIWQLSRSPDFAGSVTIALERGLESTPIPLTVATAAALFDTTWTNIPLPLQRPVMYFHRVITTDGARYTVGPTATLTLIRGTITATEQDEDVPGRFVLHGNYPNPFNPATTITFTLREHADVRLEVLDLLGRRVAVLAEGPLPAGEYTHTWETTNKPSGFYYARLQAGAFTQTRQMVLLK